MYFDFEDGHPDIEGVPRALSPREGVLLTIIVHLLAIILILVLPQLPYFKRLAAAEAAEAQRLAMLQKQQRDQTRFVFMQPRVELKPSKPPDRAPMSDRDRRALSQLQAPHPTNNRPFARGNSPEYVEKSPPPQPRQQERQAGPPQPPTPNPAPQNSSSPAQAANAADQFRLPERANHAPAPSDTTPAGGRPAGGRFTAENILRYAEQANYDNLGRRQQHVRTAPVRFQGCQLRSVDPEVPASAQAELVQHNAANGDVAARARRDHVRCSQGRGADRRRRAPDHPACSRSRPPRQMRSR